MKSSLIRHAAVVLLLSGSVATFELCKSKPKNADIRKVQANGDVYPNQEQ